ncbi:MULTISPECIES: hypothetical protein [unclassified Variovorax]|uniref:hypothetical protein n=1 Tax=unclassified Variovorax TaxID=663243 RepID=UPI00131632B3|nr:MULTISPECIES: hypothetical protein [unclassified Variovorax]VTU41621.1 hypothetical protein SRS16P1_00052 [Variovorax sp. SRS16]VTU41655.1 hypothetical protein E5P1_00052 [Variovorax sp. PBL-E5]VTU44750.1 hypothetical protein H6P1_00882 [Variovorax sp. PBL-H6]
MGIDDVRHFLEDWSGPAQGVEAVVAVVVVAIAARRWFVPWWKRRAEHAEELKRSSREQLKARAAELLAFDAESSEELRLGKLEEAMELLRRLNDTVGLANAWVAAAEVLCVPGSPVRDDERSIEYALKAGDYFESAGEAYRAARAYRVAARGVEWRDDSTASLVEAATLRSKVARLYESLDYGDAAEEEWKRVRDLYSVAREKDRAKANLIGE